MTISRKKHSPQTKVKVALEALTGEKTTAEITSKYGVHATQINQWKKAVLAVMPEAFSRQRKRQEDDQQALIDELYRQIGQLKVENDFLKKTLNIPLETRIVWIEPGHSKLSLRKQCGLLGINRSSLYYRPVGINDYTLVLMHELDQQYTATPFYGVLNMTEHLRTQGDQVNPKRVRRLLRRMGLEAVYPKPHLSQANPEHKIFPYLLRNMRIERCNQVWSTDITYIRMKHGFVYLMAIIDWYSRYVLNWALSTTLDADFCIEALHEALASSRCEIFNTDQGSQFTTRRFTEPLLDKGIQVSMDGRGRALDNIFVERLWRSVKYEKIYLNDFETVKEAYLGLKDYFDFYNHRRLHQSLDYQTPAAVLFKKERSLN